MAIRLSPSPGDVRDGLARAERPLLRAVLVTALAVSAGLFIASPGVGDTYFWLKAAWLMWLIGTLWAFIRKNFSVAFLGLQAFMGGFVLWPATQVIFGGKGALLLSQDYSAGVGGAVRILAIAEFGLVMGTVLARSRSDGLPAQRLRVLLPWRRVDRLITTLILVGMASLVAFSVLAHANLAAFNVLSGKNNYGDFYATSTGSQVQYFITLFSLLGVAMMLAVVRLTGRESHRPLFAWGVLVGCAVLLIVSGQRQRLLVPLLACGLIWWKTSKAPFGRNLRTLSIGGGAAAFVFVALVGSYRLQQVNQANIAPELRHSDGITSILSNEAAGPVNLFVTTAGLAQNVPSRLEYLSGQSYLDFFILPIPRTLWHGKPIGKMVQLQGKFFDAEIGASFPEYGEFYANFGIFGVLVGCLGFGYLLESMWLRLVATTSLARSLVLGLAIPVALQIFTRNYAAAVIAAQFGLIVGMVVVVRSVRRWDRHEPLVTALTP